MPDGLNDFGQGVLKAYLARQELDQRATQLAQEHEQAQNLLKFHYKELDSTAKQHKETLDLQKALFKQKMQEHYNELYGNVQSAPESAQYQTAGTQVSPDQPQGIIDQTPGTQGGVQADQNIGVLPGIQHQILTKANPWQINPDETKNLGIGPLTIDPEYQNRMRGLGQVQADIEGAKEGAKTKAEWDIRAPIEFQKQANKNQLDQQLEVMKLAGQYRLAGFNADASMKRAQAEIEGRHQDTLLHVNAMKEIAKQKNAPDPDAAANEFDAYTTGLTDKVSPKNTPAIDGMLRDTGYKPFTIKDKDNLNNLHSLKGLFDDMRTVINQIPDGFQGNVDTFLASKSPLALKLTNDINNIEARAPVAARGLFGIDKGRLTNMEVSSAKKALMPGGVGKEGGLSNLSRLERDRNNRIWNENLGGMPLDQKAQIIKRNGFAGEFKTNIRDSQGNVVEGNVEDLPNMQSGKVLMQDPKTKKRVWVDASDAKKALDEEGFKLAYAD